MIDPDTDAPTYVGDDGTARVPLEYRRFRHRRDRIDALVRCMFRDAQNRGKDGR